MHRRAGMVIDAHYHLWTRSVGAYDWIDPADPVLARDYHMVDYFAVASPSGVTGSVLVQADATEADTDAMLAQAAANASILAVVGWTDLTAATAPGRIEARAANAVFRGLRAMLQDDPAPDWILDVAATDALRRLTHLGLTLDALVRWRQMDIALRLADRHPDLPIVLDHGGKPPIGGESEAEWRALLDALAERPNVWCKLSGLATEAVGEPSDEALAPFAVAIVEAFGPSRVMWGSDWPVSLQAQTFAEGLAQMRRLVARAAGSDAPDLIFGRTALRFYRGTDPLSTPGT